jgi:predicted hotdog family 3-hydroxylacyl-ACP dehydratase
MIGNSSLYQHQFASLIPHAGSMVLIDAVDSWTAKQIICRTRSHKNPDNPLRLHGRLSAIHLIEYGAQTTAIHGGILSGKSAPGFLAAARGVHFYIDNLDDIAGEIIITASAELKIQNGAVYSLTINDTHNKLLFDARATVVYL